MPWQRANPIENDTRSLVYFTDSLGLVTNRLLLPWSHEGLEGFGAVLADWSLAVILIT
jgi:hypothetical protein